MKVLQIGHMKKFFNSEHAQSIQKLREINWLVSAEENTEQLLIHKYIITLLKPGLKTTVNIY